MKGLLSVAALAFLFFTACGHHENAPDTSKKEAPMQQESAAQPAPAAEPVYACPMHPEITGKAGDKCTKCKMDLKPVETVVYTCPMHPEVTGKAGDKCPKCKMDLEPAKK